MFSKKLIGKKKLKTSSEEKIQKTKKIKKHIRSINTIDEEINSLSEIIVDYLLKTSSIYDK